MDIHDQLAFPWNKEDSCGNEIERHSGMSLRDYFAAKALQGMLSRPSGQGSQFDDNVTSSAQFASECAYGYADEMIRYRQSQQAKEAK